MGRDTQRQAARARGKKRESYPESTAAGSPVERAIQNSDESPALHRSNYNPLRPISGSCLPCRILRLFNVLTHHVRLLGFFHSSAPSPPSILTILILIFTVVLSALHCPWASFLVSFIRSLLRVLSRLSFFCFNNYSLHTCIHHFLMVLSALSRAPSLLVPCSGLDLISSSSAFGFCCCCYLSI